MKIPLVSKILLVLVLGKFYLIFCEYLKKSNNNNGWVTVPVDPGTPKRHRNYDPESPEADFKVNSNKPTSQFGNRKGFGSIEYGNDRRAKSKYIPERSYEDDWSPEIPKSKSKSGFYGTKKQSDTKSDKYSSKYVNEFGPASSSLEPLDDYDSRFGDYENDDHHLKVPKVKYEYEGPYGKSKYPPKKSGKDSSRSRKPASYEYDEASLIPVGQEKLKSGPKNLKKKPSGSGRSLLNVKVSIGGGGDAQHEDEVIQTTTIASTISLNISADHPSTYTQSNLTVSQLLNKWDQHELTKDIKEEGQAEIADTLAPKPNMTISDMLRSLKVLKVDDAKPLSLDNSIILNATLSDEVTD